MNKSENPDRPNHARLLHEVVNDLHADAEAAAPPAAPETLRARLAEIAVELLEPIGRGGMGTVYRAKQHKLGRVVAVKVLADAIAESPGFAARFAQEARALASLSHPNILTVHDFGEVDGVCYLITEFVDGINLRQLLDLGQLSPAEALRITPQICQALYYAHQHGVVHRDIKPENILIDTDGQVKIADFGLAKLARAQAPLTRGTEVFGTPQYMAPEQWRNSGEVDHRADIFSLGVVLYEMLTGQLPVGDFEPPSRRSGVPPGLDDVVRRSLAQRPENRYQSAREVETDVERQSASTAGGREQRNDRARTPRSTGRKLLIGCVVLALLGALGVVAMVAMFFVLAPSQIAEVTRGPIAGSTLVGRSAAEVVQQLGPPLSISASATQTTWAYRTAAGKLLESALVFAGSAVVSYDPDAHLLAANPKPEQGPYLGQSLADVMRELGPPARRDVGALFASYEYDSGMTLAVKDGYVLGISRK